MVFVCMGLHMSLCQKFQRVKQEVICINQIHEHQHLDENDPMEISTSVTSFFFEWDPRCALLSLQCQDCSLLLPLQFRISPRSPLLLSRFGTALTLHRPRREEGRERGVSLSVTGTVEYISGTRGCHWLLARDGLSLDYVNNWAQKSMSSQSALDKQPRRNTEQHGGVFFILWIVVSIF